MLTFTQQVACWSCFIWYRCNKYRIWILHADCITSYPCSQNFPVKLCFLCTRTRDCGHTTTNRRPVENVLYVCYHARSDVLGSFLLDLLLCKCFIVSVACLLPATAKLTHMNTGSAAWPQAWRRSYICLSQAYIWRLPVCINAVNWC